MRVWVVVVLCAALAGSVAPVGAQDGGGAYDPPADTLAIVKGDTPPSNVEMAVALSQATVPATGVETVVIGRDDAFADALASGVLQDTDPLLLVPTAGPIPDAVRAEVQRMGPSRAIVLGGERAVEPQVAEELAAMGLEVQRLSGATRFDTAIAVASAAAPGSDTVILARAFEAAGSTDPSQAFADTLAGGGMAAETGWPVLLTDTARLTPVTREYMAASGVRQVEILGGTAAISAEVEAELQQMGITTERLSGASRAATAVEIAEKREAESAADVDRVMLVQGQTADAWAGGFAAAHHSAVHDAPIVLATGGSLPPETTEWLAAGSGSETATFAQDSHGIRITCVVVPSLCEEARLVLGLPPTGGGAITFDPPAGSTVDAAQPITATITAPAAEMIDEVLVTGTCLGSDNTTDAIRSAGAGTLPGDVLTLSISAAVPAGPCDFQIRVRPVEGDDQVTTATFTASGRNRIDLLSAGPDGTGVGGRAPSTSADGSVVAFTSDGQVLADVPGGTHHSYVVIDGEAELVDVAPSGDPGVAPCSSCGSPNLAVSADGSAVVFTSPDETLDPAGTADFGSGSGAYVRDLVGDRTSFVSYDSAGEPIDVNQVDIDGDGSVVTYQGQGRAASPTATSGFRTGFYTYWRDMGTGEVGVVTDPATREPIEINSANRAELSADGRFIAFSHGEPLVDEDTNAGEDTYVYDRQEGTLEVVSVGPDGTTGNTEDINAGDFRGISGDGRYVAFDSGSTDLVPDAAVSPGAVYLRDREAGTTTLLSRHPDGSPAVAQLARSRAQVSPGGTYVVFASSEDLANHDEAGCGIYRYAIATGELVRVDLGEVVHGAANCPYGVDVADSGHVVFDEISTHHADAVEANEADVYRWNPA